MTATREANTLHHFDEHGASESVQELRFPFVSGNTDLHPETNHDAADLTYRALVSYYLEQNPASGRHFLRELESADRNVAENHRFTYSVVLPPRSRTQRSQGERFTRATILCHGLNEKSWSKYRPWAARLAIETGHPVILFPTAFHMDRAPEAWANPREMIGVSRERKRLFPDLEGSSFANAALSHRLQFAPRRFLTSGLQTYYDLLDFAREIITGGHSLFGRGTRLDFFGFSIGASLVELLMMTDTERLFSESRAVLFCGGSVMDRCAPVSKMIVDRAAFLALSAFLDRFESHLANGLPLGEPPFRNDLAPVVMIQSLIHLDSGRREREAGAERCDGRIAAFAMANDPVFSPAGIVDSWTTENGRALIPVHTLDPPYEYTHDQPFPLAKDDTEVENAFSFLFGRAASHLSA